MSHKQSNNESAFSRRDFIRKGAAAGAALGIAGLPGVSSAQEAGKKKIKALLVTGEG